MKNWIAAIILAVNIACSLGFALLVGLENSINIEPWRDWTILILVIATTSTSTFHLVRLVEVIRDTSHLYQENIWFLKGPSMSRGFKIGILIRIVCLFGLHTFTPGAFGAGVSVGVLVAAFLLIWIPLISSVVHLVVDLMTTPRPGTQTTRNHPREGVGS